MSPNLAIFEVALTPLNLLVYQHNPVSLAACRCQVGPNHGFLWVQAKNMLTSCNALISRHGVIILSLSEDKLRMLPRLVNSPSSLH